MSSFERFLDAAFTFCLYAAILCATGAFVATVIAAFIERYLL